jgi:PAS domain S-box-containing protein
MLAEGHAIPLDREASLVATAARTKEPVLVDDVTDDPTFMPNPLLPDTKTEVAVPAIAGGEVLGVFDVQHDEPHYFTEADLDVFQTLAGQIANAFQSAALLEEMTEAQTRFRTVADFTYDWETWLGPDEQYIYVSPACERITGYTPQELIDNPELFVEMVHPEDREMVDSHMHEHKSTQETEPLEYRIITKDNEERWVSHACQAVYDNEGNWLGRRGSNRDITEAKQAEQAVRESEEYLRLMLQSVKDYAILTLDPDGNISSWNEGAQRIKGYTEDEIIGEHYSIFYTEEDRESGHVDEVLEIAQEQGSYQERGLRVRKDGTAFWADVTVTAIHDEDGSLRGFSKVTRDITERRKAEQAVREARDRAQTYLDMAGTIIVAMDDQGDVTLLNKKGFEVLGYEEGEVIGQSWFDLTVPEEIRGDVRAVFQKIMDGEMEQAEYYENEIVTKEGDMRIVAWHNSLLKDEDDNIIGVLSSGEDITERKQAEAERKRFTTRLETAAEISEQVGSILDPDELLEAVIPLIKEEFGLYYVHVYTLDEDSRMLNLRAGYGEAGEKMLAEGHAIPLDREASLVATAARTKEPVLVDDVTDDPTFMPNPLLPDTKTEVAVPAIAGGEVLGVFDVQHDEPHYFTEADLDVFQTLAGQIANAFQSAALLEEMTEAQTRFQTVADFTYDWETWLGPDEQYIYVSPACERITGYTPQELMDNPELVVDMAHPDDRELVESHLHEHKSTVETEPIEYRIFTKDGEERWIGHACQAVYDDDGNWLGRRGSNRNITETKQREVFLEKQSATLAELTASETVYSGDLDAALEEITEAAAQTLGVRRTSIWFYNSDRSTIECVDLYMQGEGHSDGAELSAEDYPKYFEALSEEHIIAADDAHSNPHTREFSESYLTPHGISSMLDAPIRLAGEMVGVVCSEHVGPPREWSWEERSFITSVADFVASAMEAQERQRFTTQLRTAADLAGDINAILDPEKLLPEVVNELQDRFDLYHVHIYTLDQPSIDVLEKVDVDDASRMLSERKLVMHAGSGEVGQQLLEQGHSIPIDADSLVARAARRSKVVAVDDTRQEPDFMANPLLPNTRSEVAVPLIAGDEVLGVLDVQDSQPGRFTDADLDVLQTLAGQIGIALQNAGLFEDVQVATQRLREADQRKSEFLADMSHELRTPLNSIIGYAELMLMGISEMDPDTLEDVQAIYDNGRHLLKIINNILDLSKIEAGRMELNIEEVHVPSLIEEIKVSSAGLLVDKEKPVEMRTDVDDDVPSIEADRVRLSQILNNLVGNAIKFTEKGSITLRAYTEDGWVYMEVEDTGPGMTEEDLQEIFERFRRIEDSFTRRAEGTGLGLSITRYLVDMHGGTVDVESEVGEGSTFTVCLPIQHPETDVDAEADV